MTDAEMKEWADWGADMGSLFHMQTWSEHARRTIHNWIREFQEAGYPLGEVRSAAHWLLRGQSDFEVKPGNFVQRMHEQIRIARAALKARWPQNRRNELREDAERSRRDQLDALREYRRLPVSLRRQLKAQLRADPKKSVMALYKALKMAHAEAMP